MSVNSNIVASSMGHAPCHPSTLCHPAGNSHHAVSAALLGSGKPVFRVKGGRDSSPSAIGLPAAWQPLWSSVPGAHHLVA